MRRTILVAFVLSLCIPLLAATWLAAQKPAAKPPAAGAPQAAKPAAASDKCVDCHSRANPNIIADWKQSRHSKVGVGCEACHGGQDGDRKSVV